MKAYLFGVTPVEEAFLKEWQDQHQMMKFLIPTAL